MVGTTIYRGSFSAMLCILFCLFTSPGLAQNATISGKVTDSETGEPLPGANVAVTSETGQTGAATDESGEFSVGKIVPGTYTIRVSYIGYEALEMADVVLSAGETKSVDISLNPTGIELNPISISASRRAEKTLEAPASISVIEPRELTQVVSPSSVSALKNVTGVDMATTGVDRHEVVLRGFSNAFSGATYIMTDYRRAAVPSLDVNLHSIMPNMAIDLERVEVVRGPGSALYGAGVDAGVVHYITKDPFDHPGTTFAFTGGERSSIAGHARHAGILSDNVGYKITAQYAEADDWDYNINDPLDADQLVNPVTGDTTFFDRDYQKININGLLQFKLGDDATLTANGGFSSLDATVLSGIGTVQADGYGYMYGQLRFQMGNFFAQAYLNKNDAGDSFVYGQQQSSGQRLQVVDNSTLLNLQAQYDVELADGREQLIFGVDYDRTTPDTEGTIFGRNEDDDLISEIGFYAQSQTQLSQKFDLTAALRADYNNIEEEFQLSPRAALVFKPTAEHSFRATYNRAHALPGGNSLHLDIVGLEVPIQGTPFSIVQRGRGSRNGFHFTAARAGGGITASSLFPAPGVWGENILQFSEAGVPTQNVPLAPFYGLIYNQVSQLPPEQIQALLVANGLPQLPIAVIEQFVTLLSPEQGTNVQGAGTSILEARPEDVEPLKSTITQSLEFGYKGLIREKVLFAVDAYYSQKKNFVSGVTQLTPLAFYQNPATGAIPILDDNELLGAVAQAIAANPQLGPALNAVGLSAQQVAGLLVSLGEDQLRTLMSNLPAGVVQPDENRAPGEILGGYRNFGDVDFWGVDASIQYIVNRRLNLFGNFSYISDDFFDNEELGEANPALFQALNASQFKAKAGFSYQVPKGVSFNAAARFTQAYPIASGPYIGGLPIEHPGDIGGLDDFFLLDVGAGYDFSEYAPGLRFDLLIQNVLDNEHREFIGAPEIGRLGLARLSYSM